MKTTTNEHYTPIEITETTVGQPSWFARAREQAKRLVGAGVAGLMLTGSLALSACNNPVQAIPEGQPPKAGSTENPGNPSPSENIRPTNETNTEERDPTPLSAELSPKELGKAFYKKTDEWENSLSRQEYADKYFELTDATEYRKQLVDATTKKYADALFVKGWEDNSHLERYAALTKARTNNIFSNFIASTKNKYATVRYRSWVEVIKVKVVSEDEDRVVVEVSGVEHDNSAELNEPTGSDGKKFTEKLTFDRFYDGQARLASAIDRNN